MAQVELACQDWTIFRAVQTIIQSTNLGSKVLCSQYSACSGLYSYLYVSFSVADPDPYRIAGTESVILATDRDLPVLIIFYIF